MLEATKYLKSLRAINGYDLSKMQELMPIHRVTYNRYENNPLKVDVNVLLEMVSVLNGDIDVFLNAIKQDYLSCNKKLKGE